MATLETLYSQVEEQLQINSDDSTISRDLIADLISQQRSLWLRNESNKGRTLDPDLIQDLGCVPVELVSSEECCNLNIPSNCEVIRTKCKIPNSIAVNGGKLLSRVGPVNILEKKYELIDYGRIPFTGNARFAKSSTYAFLFNEYLYIYSSDSSFKLTKYINVRGIFEDPLAVTSFDKDCGCEEPTPCYDVTVDNYPLSSWMWEYIRPIVVEQLMKKQIIPLDQSNDTKDNKTEMSTKRK